MSDATTRTEWVDRVLGIRIGEAAPADGGAFARPGITAVWIDAKEEVDKDIDKLQRALRETGDEDLAQVAEYGLFASGEGVNVTLMAALREAEGGTPGGLDKVRDAVADYRDFLAGAPIVDLIEDNPFGVAVPLRQTLGAALTQLDTLARAA